MKKIFDALKLAGQWLVLTNFGRLLLGIIILVVSQIMQDRFDSMFWTYLCFASVVYLGGYVTLFIIFAWIINPYKDWKEAKRQREEASKK